MSLDVRVINKRHNPRVEGYLRQRLGLAVGRFGMRLSAIDVHLRDNNAQKGAIDKTCSIDAHLMPRGTIHVQATERDIYEAIQRAVHRLETVVSKTVDRGNRSMAIRHAKGGSRNADSLKDPNDNED
jgi:ribosome-associated translation inhibitor RaiA